MLAGFVFVRRIVCKIDVNSSSAFSHGVGSLGSIRAIPKNVRRKRGMAFGDSMNDYEIMRMVGVPVAMGNARFAIKQIAAKVIGTNVEHSVQKELRALLDA